MNTFIYMVRLGFTKRRNERTRGLTERGKLDVRRVTDLLKNEGINIVISSPYTRSILTVEPLAKQIGQEVLVFEGFKERIFSAEDKRIPDKELLPLLEKSYLDPNFNFRWRGIKYRLQKEL